MFIGHQAVALVAKRFTPRTSLGILFMAVQFLDLLWPAFLLTGIEHVRIDPGNTAFNPLDFYDYPYTHSLVFALIWSVVFALVYNAFRHDSRAAWILGGCVLSHWILDAIVHTPDLPLYPGSLVRVGLGLWQSVPGTLVVELSIFVLGTVIYLRSTSATKNAGQISFWTFVVFIVLIYLASIGSPPPNVTVLAGVALSAWLFVAWGHWIDRNRRKR